MIALGAGELAFGAVVAAAVFMLVKSKVVRVAVAAFIAGVLGQVVGTYLSEMEPTKLFSVGTAAADFMQSHFRTFFTAVGVGIGAAVALLLKKKP